MVSVTQLPPEFLDRIHDRIHVPTEGLLGAGNRADDLLERHVSHDQQIDVASVAKLATRARPENEGDPDRAFERTKGISQDRRRSDRLAEKRLQLGEDRRSAVRLEIDLPAVASPRDDAGYRELVQLATQGTDGDTRGAGDLSQEEALVRMAEKPAEDAAAGLAKEDVGRVPRYGRSQLRNDCNQFENDPEARPP